MRFKALVLRSVLEPRSEIHVVTKNGTYVLDRYECGLCGMLVVVCAESVVPPPGACGFSNIIDGPIISLQRLYIQTPWRILDGCLELETLSKGFGKLISFKNCL